jgi:hypothetical protein
MNYDNWPKNGNEKNPKKQKIVSGQPIRTSERISHKNISASSRASN